MSQVDDSKNDELDDKDGDNSKPLVTFRVSEDSKEEWEEHIENSDGRYQSLSHFLRLSAQHEVAGQNDSVGLDPSEIDVGASDEVLNQLERINDRLDSIERSLTILQTDQYEDKDISELATEIYQLLPTTPQGVTEALIGKAKVEPPDSVDPDSSPYSGHATTGSMKDLSEVLDVPESKVEKAIWKLENDSKLVKRSERDGTTYYYRVE